MDNILKNTLQKRRFEDFSESDRQEILALFHRPEKEFELKEMLFEDLASQTPTDAATTLPDFQSLFYRLWAKIEQNKLQQKSKSRVFGTVLKIAAILVLGLFIGMYVSSLKKTSTKPVYYAAHSPKGSISEMILPDGSVIFLNAGSHIKYSIDGENGIREVFLDGEAWFDVEGNKKKPFVVHTHYYDVKVTGTEFNVKAYETDQTATTTLEKGEVIIQSIQAYKFANDIILKPGEQAALSKDSRQFTINTVNTKWFTSWKDNKLIFVNMNLKDLVVLLERKYGVEIEVKNKEILDLHFDGTIKNESIIEFLEIVQKTLPINYKIVGQKIEITNS